MSGGGGGGPQDYSASSSQFPTLDWDFLDLDWTGSGDLGMDLRIFLRTWFVIDFLASGDHIFASVPTIEFIISM